MQPEEDLICATGGHFATCGRPGDVAYLLSAQDRVDPLVLRGRAVLPDGLHPDAVVALAGGVIEWTGAAGDWSGGGRSAGWPEPTAVDGMILPGLVDVHCHGAAGHGFPDGDLDGARAAADHHRRHGTTALLASLVTASEPELMAALDACASLAETGQIAGIHLEGPFLSVARCGAQDPSAIRDPDLAMLARLLDAGRGQVRTMTYAPEVPGASALADLALGRGVVPSVGHTDADAGTTRAAFAQATASTFGRSSVTHLFNGMPVMHHRSPGPAAAALAAAARGETVVELVADGVHLAPETVSAVFDLVGPDQVALVTDAMPAAGLGDGRYRLGRLDVEVIAGTARLAADTRTPTAPSPGGATVPETTARPERSIAGGTARLVDVVRHAVQVAGVDLVAAVTAATATPARLLGLERVAGSLAPGLRADVVVVDQHLRPVRVIVGGRPLDQIGPADD